MNDRESREVLLHKPVKKRRKTTIVSIVILILALAVIGIGYFFISSVRQYNHVVKNYNEVVDSYNQLNGVTSIDNIEGMVKNPLKKDFMDDGIRGCIALLKSGVSPFSVRTETEKLSSEMNTLLYDYCIMQQITDPSEKWVLEKLSEIGNITGLQAVTKDNDPNGFLGKESGYTACIYFTVKDIDSDTIKGNDIVAKGTDAGGAIEIYENADDAESRCEYLSQFDNTLLYSGSYAILGTMVIRTSYALSNEEQIQLTNDITCAFTEIK